MTYEFGASTTWVSTYSFRRAAYPMRASLGPSHDGSLYIDSDAKPVAARETTMSDSKGKTAVHRANNAEGDASDQGGDAFEDVGFLEDSNALLDKIKTTAENVTTCQVRALSKRLRRGHQPADR